MQRKYIDGKGADGSVSAFSNFSLFMMNDLNVDCDIVAAELSPGSVPGKSSPNIAIQMAAIIKAWRFLFIIA